MAYRDKKDKNQQIELRISQLDTLITESKTAAADLASLYFERGRQWWRLGEKGKAISDYERAAALDADSPAIEALALARRIMNFYHTDLYNP